MESAHARAADTDTLSPNEGKALNRFTFALLFGYLVFIVALMVTRRSTLSPELFVVFAAIGAVILGRGLAFIRDWTPFFVIFLAWQMARAVADDIGARVQSDAIIAVERVVALGVVPSEEIQRLLHTPGAIGPLDLAMTLVYWCHFLLPLVAALGLWVVRRPLYYRYLMALALLSIGQFFTAVLLPVAPPRFAHLYGAEALSVVDISVAVSQHLELGTLTWAYHNLNGNPVAAFPSLHAAYPVLAFLYLRKVWPRGSFLMLAWGAVVIFAIVYLAHHYVVDALGGIAYTIAAFLVVERLVPASWPRNAVRWLTAKARPARSAT